MSYVAAAYGLVVGGLMLYWAWLRARRKTQERAAQQERG
jgi:hypothetical protein